jgi:hypothetical protein
VLAAFFNDEQMVSLEPRGREIAVAEIGSSVGAD